MITYGKTRDNVSVTVDDVSHYVTLTLGYATPTQVALTPRQARIVADGLRRHARIAEQYVGTKP